MGLDRGDAAVSTQHDQSYKKFIRRALHDLGAPVRHVQLFSEMLRDEIEPEQISEAGVEYLDVIDRASQTMKGIIESLGDYLRLPDQAGGSRNVDVRTLLEQGWAELLADQPEGVGQLEIEGDLTLETDPVLLEKMLREVLKNALRFRKPNMTARVRALLHHDNDHGSIQIHDDGVGIEPEFLQRVLLPFETLPQDGVKCGPGLGLPLCQKIASLLSGELQLQSEAGSGVAVAITLPLRTAQV